MSEAARSLEDLELLDTIPDDPLERLLLRVRLHARRRLLWLRSFWPDGAGGIADHVDLCLAGYDAPEAEAEWRRHDPEASALGARLERLAQCVGADSDAPLRRLETTFGIDVEESDVLQTCVAARLDPSIGRAFAYLQSHAGRAYPTEELVARLYGHGHRRALGSESSLRRWALVVEQAVAPGEPRALTCDPQIYDWLLGIHRLDDALVGAAELHAPLPPLPRWPVAATASLIERILHGGDGVPPGRIRLRVTGVPGSGRRTLAAAACARLGLPLVVIDADAIDEADWAHLFVRAQRQAFLDRCAVAWVGEAALARRWPERTALFPVQILIAEPGQVAPPIRGVVDEVVDMPQPSLTEREALWRNQVPAARSWPPEAVAALGARHRLTLAEIADLGRRPVPGPEEAALLVREASRHRLGELATFVDCPFRWDDLVVPDGLRAALEDFAHEATDRAAFWEQPAARRLFPQGQGLFALFSGPPGTGKTMAAQVIAAHLELDLFRISLSSVVSKYVGETAKNLERILARAETMDAVLLFDEADALFSKRTEVKDAHDRFANTDTNYLLQAIEAYRGIALLATNKKGNIDGAFVRRIRYVLEFPKPDAAQRRRLWSRLVGELAGEERGRALARDLDLLGEAVELTGAQIKYAVLAALFAARRDGQPLARAHLLRGLERELIKEGRALNERDRERLGV